jgi:hypothetical protein
MDERRVADQVDEGLAFHAAATCQTVRAAA